MQRRAIHRSNALHKQLSASRQLLDALAERGDRAVLWNPEDDEQQQAEHVALSTLPEGVPLAAAAVHDAVSSELPSPRSPQQQQQQQQQPPPTLQHMSSSLRQSITARVQGNKQQQLLLQYVLCPLTRRRAHCADGSGLDAASTVLRTDDLQPHAQPVAKQVYAELVTGYQACPWYMLKPDGAARLAWDLLMFIFITGLVFYVPILIAFTAPLQSCNYFIDRVYVDTAVHVPPPGPSGVTFLTLTNAAFLVDICLNFLTGVVVFTPETHLYSASYDLRTVASKYTRTWLVLDVLSCLPLECMLSAGGMWNNYNLGHLNRLLKVAGTMRRAHGDPFRLIDKIPYLKKNFNYSMRLVAVSASCLFLGLHYFACGLWLVLRVQNFPSNTWPVLLNLVPPGGGNVYAQWSWSVFAVTSAMIGLGYGSFPPMTLAECILWTVEMIVMAGGFATVNAFIFAAILETVSESARCKAQLTRALQEAEHRHLPPALTDRVMAYYQLRSGRHREMPTESIMHELAPGLRLQVALASVGNTLHSIPVFGACPQLLQRIALLVEPQVAAEGQLITIPGTPATHMYFVTQGFADVFAGDVLLHTLGAGDSFCEAALLPVPAPKDLPPRLAALWRRSFTTCSWMTLFQVRALSHCTLMVLEREAARKVLQEYGWANEMLHELGALYAQALAELPFLEEVWAHAASFDPLANMLPHARGQPGAADGVAPGCSGSSGGGSSGQPGAGLWDGLKRRYNHRRHRQQAKQQAFVGPHV